MPPIRSRRSVTPAARASGPSRRATSSTSASRLVGRYCTRLLRENWRKSPTRLSRRFTSSRMTPTSSLHLAGETPAGSGATRRSRIDSCRAIELSGLRTSWARPEAKVPDHRHLLALDDAGLGLVELAVGAARLVVEARVLERDRGLRGERLGHVHLVLGPVVWRAREVSTRRPRVALRATRGRMRAAPPAQRRGDLLVDAARRASSPRSRGRTCSSSARRWRLSPIAVRSTSWPLRSSGWGSPARWRHLELRAGPSRAGCDTRSTRRTSRAVSADRREHGLGVERLADALVERGQGPRLLVVEPLGLRGAARPRRRGRAGGRRSRGSAARRRRTWRPAGPPRSGRRGSCRRTRAARWRAPPAASRPAAIIGMRGHSSGVAGLPPVAGRETSAAEALAEAPRLRHARGTRARSRGERRGGASRPSPPGGRPRPSGGRGRSARASRVESRMAWTSSSPWRRAEIVGEDRELAFAVLHRLLERADDAREPFAIGRSCGKSCATSVILTQGADRMGVGLASVHEPPRSAPRAGAAGRARRCAMNAGMGGICAGAAPGRAVEWKDGGD